MNVFLGFIVLIQGAVLGEGVVFAEP